MPFPARDPFPGRMIPRFNSSPYISIMQTKRRAPEEVAITDGRKIARELFGLFLIFWGLLVLLSLVSFDQNDPSINHAVSNPAIVKNYAGLFGAYLSGLLVDIFGFAALVWPLVFLAWGAGCVSTWFTMPWWRWFGFTLLAACLISLGAAWNLGIGDVRGGGMLGMSLYTKFTTLFSPVGSSLIWLFLLFISLEMAFGIAWIALIRKGWALLREQLSGTPFSLDDLPERLSKVSMPKVALPKIGLPHKDKKAEGETAADVIALFDIHDEEERPAPKREEPLSMDPPFSLTPEETTAAPKKDAGDPLKLWEPPSEHDTFDFQPEEPRAGTGTFAPQVNIHLASPTDAAARAVNLLAGENPLLALTIPETQPAPRGLRRNRKFNPCSRMRRSSKLRFSLHNPTRKSRNRRFLTPRSSLGTPLRSRRSKMPHSPLPSGSKRRSRYRLSHRRQLQPRPLSPPYRRLRQRLRLRPKPRSPASTHPWERLPPQRNRSCANAPIPCLRWTCSSSRSRAIPCPRGKCWRNRAPA